MKSHSETKRRDIVVRSYLLVILMLLLCSVTVYAAPFTASDGVVTDQGTGLMWQQTDDDTERTWQEALDYCKALTLGGYTDWRLPNKKELESIVDYAAYNPAISPEFSGTDVSYFWSSTSNTNNTDFAWFVYFGSGFVNYGYKTHLHYTRCVR